MWVESHASSFFLYVLNTSSRGISKNKNENKNKNKIKTDQPTKQRET